MNNNKPSQNKATTSNSNVNNTKSLSDKRHDRLLKLQNEANDAKAKGLNVLGGKDYLKVFEKNGKF